MSLADEHRCNSSQVVSQFAGEPRMLFTTTCSNTECPFTETSMEATGRDKAASDHQRIEARKALFRGLDNAVKGDRDALKRALVDFADISTHEFGEWSTIVTTLVDQEFKIHLEVPYKVLKEFYDIGKDARTAAGTIAVASIKPRK